MGSRIPQRDARPYRAPTFSNLVRQSSQVSFAMRFFVDGGETAVDQAGRTVPELQVKI